MQPMILIPIKPRHMANILNGIKTAEIRTSKTLAKAVQKQIDEYGYATLLAYCSKGDDLLHRNCAGWWVEDKEYRKRHKFEVHPITYNAEVICKFECRKVEHFEYEIVSTDISGYWLDNGNQFNIKPTCLTEEELWNYVGGGDGAYALHISNLTIFDKPKELTEFRKLGKKCKYQGQDEWRDYCSHCDCIGDELTKAPQNFCYVEESI